jgi:hypothetical protein
MVRARPLEWSSQSFGELNFALFGTVRQEHFLHSFFKTLYRNEVMILIFEYDFGDFITPEVELRLDCQKRNDDQWLQASPIRGNGCN